MHHITVPKHCVCSGRYRSSHLSRCQNESKQPWGSWLYEESVSFFSFFLLKRLSLRLLFSSDFSLNVLIKFVINKKRSVC